MITLYTWTTPNGRKISIALEELGLRYETRPIDISRGDQFTPEFLALNPNNRIPVIVDDEGPDGQPITVIESGAILLYLAEKTGRLLPAGARGRCEAIQWLMFQMGSVGPMLGQAHHFLRYAPEVIPYAVERYTKEAERIYGVLNTRLAGRDWLAGADYSVADIATFPWIASHDWQEIDLDRFPEVRRWFDAIAARPAVQRGMAVPR
ncbi:glutathione S-transferase family protein [Aromatoleum aromaticum]|uniref:glutathione S-transferase family protein n=1 Tax=Aromatoleum aromaticum TaxID=551760 RepID=UPI0014596A8F|nr:glutathione S-transferase family protein [Aromatoleum aromaticum]NMG54342.1 glutathione S-transferase family protein [Aromatoleum aromaticum]